MLAVEFEECEAGIIRSMRRACLVRCLVMVAGWARLWVRSYFRGDQIVLDRGGRSIVAASYARAIGVGLIAVSQPDVPA
jgi:hypothetical protein